MAAQITLARALKLKNRLNGRFSEVTSEIQTYNSQAVFVAVQPIGGEAPPKTEVDVEALFKKRDALRAAILSLKMLINKANGPIQQAIYDIAEAKGDITFYSGLSTTSGFSHNYHGQPGGTLHVAFKKKSDVDAKKRELEAQVDALQEQIDKHNHKTHIEVDDSVIELAS